jgi:hypothetical protein
LAALQFQLMIVGDMLVIASPASAEVGTDRLDAVDRPQDNFLELRPVKAAPALDQFSFDPFTVYGALYKNNFSADPTDAGAAECDVMDVDFGFGFCVLSFAFCVRLGTFSCQTQNAKPKTQNPKPKSGWSLKKSGFVRNGRVNYDRNDPSTA